MNLATILQEQAQSRPTVPAIIDTFGGHDRVTTFGTLQQQVTWATALLYQAGLRPGDEVLVFQPMSTELYVALIAIFRLGLVAMFIDPAQGIEHIEGCCSLIAPKAFIGSPKAHLLRLFSPALHRIPRKFVIGAHLPGAIPWSSLAQLQPKPEIYQAGPETPALLTFTSGSTGEPKAALRTHGFLFAQHHVLKQHFGGQAEEVNLTTLPIFVLANLASGVTSLIAAGNLRKPGSIKPAPIIAQIERYQPTRAGASPAFWERITTYCQQHKCQIPHLRAIYAGGAPVFPRLLDLLQKAAPQAEIVAVYGSTEAEPIAHIARGSLCSEDLSAMSAGKGLLVGIPTPEIHLRILHYHWGQQLQFCTPSEFAALCVPIDTPGEIIVSGGHVLPGYVNGHGDKETKFRVDNTIWHRTGDMGYLDSQGRLWLLGRCMARIKDQYGTLYPFTVECAISSHPDIRRSAATAFHEQRILVLELEKHAPSPDLQAISQSVAWANFDAIRIYKHLPVDKRHNAKIDYPALHQLLEADLAARTTNK